MIPYDPEWAALIERHLRMLRWTLALAYLALTVEAAALAVVAAWALTR